MIAAFEILLVVLILCARASANTGLRRKDAEPVIMRAAQKGVLHKNSASRKVSRLVARIAKQPGGS